MTSHYTTIYDSIYITHCYELSQRQKMKKVQANNTGSPKQMSVILWYGFMLASNLKKAFGYLFSLLNIRITENYRLK